MKPPRPRKTVKVTVARTAIIGGGTAYTVYWPADAKRYRPIVGHVYATVVLYRGRAYYRASDWLRTPEIDATPAMTHERRDAFRRLGRIARRLDYRVACRAYPELRALDPREGIPPLWAHWRRPSADRRVTVIMHDRDGRLPEETRAGC